MGRKPLSKGHRLGTARGGASEDIERKWSKGHSPSGCCGGRDMSGHKMKGVGWGALTQTAKGGTHQNTKKVTT